MRYSEKRSVHYDIDMVEMTDDGNSSASDPERLVEVVAGWLTESQVRWKIIAPLTKESV
jgi:hypothetical protein